MPTANLTARFVAKATCPPDKAKVVFFDCALAGFMLEVRSSGKSTFYKRITDERGRKRQINIGPAERSLRIRLVGKRELSFHKIL